MNMFSSPRAIVVIFALAVLGAGPAGGHTADWWTCDDPSGGAGNPDDYDCTAHLHWSDKPDLLSVDVPGGAVLNHDEDSAYPDGADDPDDGERVGQLSLETNLSTDLDCSASDDLQDRVFYDITWEDSWSSYSPPTGWYRVAQWRMNDLLMSQDIQVLYSPGSDEYVLTPFDLPDSIMCSGAPTNLRLVIHSHENDNNSSEWVIKNPPSGTYSVCATATLTTSVQHTDCDDITV